MNSILLLIFTLLFYKMLEKLPNKLQMKGA